MNHIQKTIEFLKDVRKTFEFHKSLGIDEYPVSQAPKKSFGKVLGGAESQRRKEVQPEANAKQEKGETRATVVSTKISLQDIRVDLGECTRCELHENRNQLVFGEGHDSAKLFIVGEWPSEEDDRQGKPFCDEAGVLLDKMLAAINMSRQDVYITNIVKCHPSENRPPSKKELEICKPFLLRQISRVSPKVICTMGQLAAQTLLNTEKLLIHLRGRFHDFQGVPLMPTFHPDFLNKNAEMKKAAWQDLQLIQKCCGK